MRRMKGFTLVELLLTIIVVAIIAGVSAQVLLRGIDTYSLVTSRRDALENARIGMDRMISEMLLVRSSDITGISPTRLDFTDSAGNPTNFKRHSYQGTIDLFRNNDFLAGQIALLNFTYYRSDGTFASFPSDVRMIGVELTVQSVGGYGTVPLRTRVFPRNFMYNGFQ